MGCWSRCVAFLVVIPFVTALSQDPPGEWGEVSATDFQTSADTSSPAIILFDYGESQINSDLGVTFRRHERIKILSQAGYSWGKQVVALYTAKHEESISNIEGITYSLLPDGTVQEKEMSDDDVFMEKVDERHSRARFALPALQPGCIIEFRYQVKFEHPFSFPTWRFQNSIPTLWSEYRTVFPTTMSYAKVTFTFTPFDVNESQKKRVRIGGANEILEDGNPVCDVSRWVMRDLPALRTEPYITTIDDYTPQVRFQLAEYATSYAGVKRILRTWEQVIDELLGDKNYGRFLEHDAEIDKLAQRVTAGKQSALDKLIATYDFVRSTIVWNGKYQADGSALDDLLEKKSGATGEVNFLLMALLRSAGLDVSPVLASTRSNGKVIDVYPLVDQFNTTVALVRVNGVGVILDATDPNRPFDLLPKNLLNVPGLVVAKGPAQWVSIATPRQFHRRTASQCELNAEGEIRGVFMSAEDQYAALQRRSENRGKRPLDVAYGVFDAATLGLTLDSSSVTGIDTTDGPVSAWARAAWSPYAQVSGGRIYCSPMIIDRMSKNPFTLKDRKFAVDMGYGTDITSTSILRIPEGYTIVEVPGNIVIGGEDISYRRKTVTAGNVVRTETRLAINVSKFPPEVYQSLKSFYDSMIAADAEQLVLQKGASGGTTR